MFRTGAILVAGNDELEPFSPNTDRLAGNGRQRSSGFSQATVEVLGQTILERTAARLQKFGLSRIDVIAGTPVTPQCTRNLMVRNIASYDLRWLTALRTVNEHARQGISAVLIAEVGAYAEFDLHSAIEFHLLHGQAATPISDTNGSLRWWIVDPARAAAARNLSLPFTESALVHPPVPCVVEGYVNRLANARDLRHLIVDAFLGRCSVVPHGREVRPGIWVDDAVCIAKTVRLVAPVFVGRNTRLKSAAVIARFTNIERDCRVGEGTVIANASILSHTSIGKGLGISDALVKGGDFIALSRGLRLRLQDSRLISDTRSTSAGDFSRERERIQPSLQPEAEYSYLARAAGRLPEVFKGEV